MVIEWRKFRFSFFLLQKIMLRAQYSAKVIEKYHGECSIHTYSKKKNYLWIKPYKAKFLKSVLIENEKKKLTNYKFVLKIYHFFSLNTSKCLISWTWRNGDFLESAKFVGVRLRLADLFVNSQSFSLSYKNNGEASTN